MVDFPQPQIRPLLGNSPQMQRVYRQIAKVARLGSTLLITGETGTGKELVARAVHALSTRGCRAFVPVDCAALPPAIIESELFGHARGAFTGAIENAMGLIRSADGGTLFLDEIGEMPLELQVKLLRVLQEREVRPVGAVGRVKVDVRVIAATHRNLTEQVRLGRFREDLYFRLNVLQIHVPPLRERVSDIALLAATFLEESDREGDRPASISPEATAALEDYSWPGNVRELQSAIWRAAAFCAGEVIRARDLPPEVTSNIDGAQTEHWSTSGPQACTIRELQRVAILRAVTECGGDKVVAARSLGIGRSTLYRKLREYANLRLSRGRKNKRVEST